MAKRIFVMTCAFILGFALSVSVFACVTVLLTVSPSSNTLRGQLVAGGPNIYGSYSTTAGIIGHADQNPVMVALSSYMWWAGVVIGAVIATILIMRTLLHSIMFVSDTFAPQHLEPHTKATVPVATAANQSPPVDH